MSIAGKSFQLDNQGSKTSKSSLPFDIIICREILRIATNIDLVRVLINTDVIHFHSGWESEMLEVDITKVFRHAQVNDDVLWGRQSNGAPRRKMAKYHWFLGHRPCWDFNTWIGAKARYIDGPRWISVWHPSNVLMERVNRRARERKSVVRHYHSLHSFYIKKKKHQGQFRQSHLVYTTEMNSQQKKRNHVFGRNIPQIHKQNNNPRQVHSISGSSLWVLTLLADWRFQWNHFVSILLGLSKFHYLTCCPKYNADWKAMFKDQLNFILSEFCRLTLTAHCADWETSPLGGSPPICASKMSISGEDRPT